MGNNVELKYEDINSVIVNLNIANNILDSAYKTLGESTDLGSSIMQSFWKFGGKEEVFNNIKKARENIKIEKEENQGISKCLREIPDIYENAGKAAAVSSSNSNWQDVLINLGIITYAYPAVSFFGSIIAAWSSYQIVSYVSSAIPQISNNIHTIVTNGVTELQNAIVGSASAVSNVSTVANISGASTVVNFTSIGETSVVENTTAAEVSNHIDLIAGQCLNDIWQNWSPVSPNGFTNYNGKGNCTWYADNRWSQKNPGNPLKFNGRGGNAKNWINSIDKSKLNVLSTSDPNNITGNAIAVSQSGTYGHVAYVEQVKDGVVYYTEDGESWTRPHTWQKDTNGQWVGPTVQSCSLSEFKNKFGNIITTK